MTLVAIFIVGVLLFIHDSEVEKDLDEVKKELEELKLLLQKQTKEEGVK